MLNLSDLGAIGGQIGGSAAVISLIYLYHLFRHNSRQNMRQMGQNYSYVEASMYHATNSAFTNWFALLAQDGDLLALWRRALVDEDLTLEEMKRVHSLIATLFLSRKSNCRQLRLGAVSDKAHATATWELSALLARPVVRAWWKLYGVAILTTEFREAVESLIPLDGR